MSELVMFESAEQRRQAMQEVLQLMVSGESHQFLQNYLLKAYGIKSHNATHFLIAVRNEAALITSQDAETIVPMHLEMYEQIYQFFHSIKFMPGKLKAMRFKEKLMGFHKEERSITINNKNTTIIETEVVYDTNKLQPTEQVRLQQLLEKAKGSKQ